MPDEQSWDVLYLYFASVCRQGSGSACRSVYGGFVKWEMGEREDGADSIAVQVTETPLTGLVISISLSPPSPLSVHCPHPPTHPPTHSLTHSLTHSPTHSLTPSMQVSPASHWPELEVLVLVVSAEKKPISSTRGMQASVQTSPLMKV